MEKLERKSENEEKDAVSGEITENITKMEKRERKSLKVERKMLSQRDKGEKKVKKIGEMKKLKRKVWKWRQNGKIEKKCSKRQ